ncbi:hypothetical protein FACS189445_5880 [Spirochaetia bacterium]|nr:hypothetical protein FACS189445_5880 [Spirochaetia bacterium]
MRKGDPAARYREHLRRERKVLGEFAAHEIEWADDLLLWYRVRKQEIPDDEYRAAAYFKNKEFQRKPGSLTLLYSMYTRMLSELPEPTPEIAFDLLAFRYRMYAVALKQGGYD